MLVGHWYAHDLLRGVSLGWEEDIQRGRPRSSTRCEPNHLEYLKVRLHVVHAQDPDEHALAVVQDVPPVGEGPGGSREGRVAEHRGSSR